MPQNPDELIAKALEIAVPRARRSMVFGEALRNAGLLDVPSDDEAYCAFVEGPLRLAATSVVNEAAGQTLMSLLLRCSPDLTSTLPLVPRRGPTQPAGPRQRHADIDDCNPVSTLSYGDAKKRRGDIAILSVDEQVETGLRRLLEPHGYRLFAVNDASRAVKLCEHLHIKFVLVGNGDGSDTDHKLRQSLGAATPQVVALSEQPVDGSLVDTLDALSTPP